MIGELGEWSVGFGFGVIFFKFFLGLCGTCLGFKNKRFLYDISADSFEPLTSFGL